MKVLHVEGQVVYVSFIVFMATVGKWIDTI